MDVALEANFSLVGGESLLAELARRISSVFLLRIPNKMKMQNFVIASEAKQSQCLSLRLPRRRAPRNDILGQFFYVTTTNPISGTDNQQKKSLIYPDPFPGRFAVRYCPTIWQMMVLVLGRVSKSTNTICCHVPKVICPSTIGTLKDAPSSEARTCEWPLSSCQVSSCS